MITSAIVKIWGKTAGTIIWNSDSGLGTFEYDPSFYLNGWDIAPIKMPLIQPTSRGARPQVFSFPEHRQGQSNTFKGLPGLLADVLPDRFGQALIDTWLIQNGRQSGSMNPVEMLCYIGNRGMGALEFEPAVQSQNSRSSALEIDSLVSLVGEVMTGKLDFETNLKADKAKALNDILLVGTSAGGARAKAIIAYNESTGVIRTGQAEAPEGFEHWLIKFDGVQDAQFGASSGYGRVEMAYHLMAVAAGIEMTTCHLLEENGRAHFMTKRFDRLAGDQKVHIQSLCALNHYDFANVGMSSYSYDQVFETMRELGLPYPAAIQMYRRMVFNVLSRNCDDHTRNIAFMMDQNGKWALTPAYDICHAYRPISPWVSQQSLGVNGKRNNISDEDLLAVGKRASIKQPKVIIDEIRSVVSDWTQYANRTGTPKPLETAIKETLLV